jgi:ABC-type lipoprotein release transport system permease subunit
MCLRNLVKRKLRTFLTILGVMVGTAAIVVMVSLGLAINEKFAQQIENMGDVTLITLYDYSRYQWGGDSQTRAPKLDSHAIAAFERIPGVVVATPIFQGQLYFRSGKYQMTAWYCMGLKPEAMPLLGFVPAEGRLLQEGDKYDAVFGALAEKFFQHSLSNRWEDRVWDAYMGGETATYVNVFEDKITMSFDPRFIGGQAESEKEYDIDDENAPRLIRPIDVNVVGLLEFKENDYMRNAGIYFDIEVLKELAAMGKKAEQESSQEGGRFSAVRGGDADGYEQVYVKCTDINVTKDVFERIREMGFDGSYPAQWLDSMQEAMQSLQMLLAAIGAVSLFVAAIGIANTMVMAIYERTREIGVMKVIGAAIKDIKRLFLLESAMIGFFGGIFGIGLSLLASYTLNNADITLFNEMSYIGGDDSGGVSLITPWLCGAALVFASLVGLISGYFPARRAMRLSALSAIRTE